MSHKSPARSTLILTGKQVQRLITMKEAIRVVAGAFKEKGEGKVQMPPKVYITLDEFGGDFRVMPTYLLSSHAAGVKIVNVHPNNPKKHGLPTVMATIVLLEPETGYPICVMDGTWLTAIRTGAGAGVATEHLAKQGQVSVGIIGAGVQARTQLMALVDVRPVSAVRVYDISPESSERFVKDMGKLVAGRLTSVSSVDEATRGVDVIVTATPAKEPILFSKHVGPGVHINAIGADAPGKQELDTGIMTRAKVVVDDMEQASHSGEVQTCLREGLLTRDDIYAELGDIVAGKKKGRESDDEITVFDSTGLAIQDVSVALAVYRNAVKKRLGTRITML
ncbi:MAG TPA: alanine dehydrogenase [Thermoproteota archaeon]|nr:alanine dehydrogenase [Thermoproteota archaeon]